MSGKICYLGDGRIDGAAGYLAGVMLHYGLEFDHVPSDVAPPADFAMTPYALYVVSDYPAATFGAANMACAARRVAEGAGLAMFGGWESYYGRLGEYHTSPLADVLPVSMQTSDDRRNYAQPCLLEKATDHPLLEGLPWDTPPGIGGWNVVTPKPGATLLLSAVRYTVQRQDGAMAFSRGESAPLLTVGVHGRGRTAALATDVAPHWVGGFVDWGDRRVIQDIPGGFIDVGNWYAQFFKNLLMWTGHLENVQ